MKRMVLMGFVFSIAISLMVTVIINIEFNLTYKMRLKQEARIKDLVESYDKNSNTQSLDSVEREIKYELSKLEVDINEVKFEPSNSSNQLKITTWNKKPVLFNKPHIEERVYIIDLN